jgi:hypothetical protein
MDNPVYGFTFEKISSQELQAVVYNGQSSSLILTSHSLTSRELITYKRFDVVAVTVHLEEIKFFCLTSNSFYVSIRILDFINSFVEDLTHL